LEGEPLAWPSHDYRVRRGSEEIALIDLAALRSRGEFLLDGESYEFRPAGVMSGDYQLEQAGRVIARAERTRLLPAEYRITAGDRQLYLKRRLPTRTYRLYHGDRVVGEVRRRRIFFSRAFLADFQEILPLPAEIFIVAIVLLRWRKQSRAARA